MLSASLCGNWSCKTVSVNAGDGGADPVWQVAGLCQIPLPVKILKAVKVVFKYSNLGLGETLSLPTWKEINCVKCLLLKASLTFGLSDLQEGVDPSHQMQGRSLSGRSPWKCWKGQREVAPQIGGQDEKIAGKGPKHNHTFANLSCSHFSYYTCFQLEVTAGIYKTESVDSDSWEIYQSKVLWVIAF